MADTGLGERLKNLRNDLGKTQDDVAKHLGITRAAYSHLENNRNEPDNTTLITLAEYFGVTVDYLLGKNQTPKWANEKDATDLAAFLKDNAGSMTYKGENLTEDEKEKLEIAMTQIFWKRHKHD